MTVRRIGYVAGESPFVRVLARSSSLDNPSRSNLVTSGLAFCSLYNPNGETLAASKEFLNGVIP